MANGLIELNDAAINLGTDGELVGSSIGMAVVDGDTLHIGDAGQRHFKMLPRWTNHRFWDQLGTDPLGNATGAIRHHADLAFAQLESLWQTISGEVDELVIAVPAFFDRHQLSLLLGMAKEAKLPVVGLVDLGLLSIARRPSHQTALFLDIGLHRITLTEFRTEGLLRLTQTHTVSETGLFTFWDRWASLVAEQFIQTSRYDPLHEATSEQRLFDLLPAWIQAASDERARTFELDVGEQKHVTTVSRDQLLQATSSIYPTIVQLVRQFAPEGQRTSLFVSSRFRGFPALNDSLQLIPNIDVAFLPADAAVANAAVLWKNLVPNADAVAHVTSLPASTLPLEASDTPPQATHLLVGHHAYSLKRPLRIAAINEDGLTIGATHPLLTVSRRGTETIADIQGDVLLNGEALSGECTLKSGDQLSAGGQTALVIAER